MWQINLGRIHLCCRRVISQLTVIRIVKESNTVANPGVEGIPLESLGKSDGQRSVPVRADQINRFVGERSRGGVSSQPPPPPPEGGGSAPAGGRGGGRRGRGAGVRSPATPVRGPPAASAERGEGGGGEANPGMPSMMNGEGRGRACLGCPKTKGGWLDTPAWLTRFLS